MNLQLNAKTRSKSQSITDAYAALYKTIIHLQPLSDLPNIFLIQHAGKSPPGYSRSSGRSLILLPDINSTACKGIIINNRANIKHNKSKANFIY